LINLFSSPVFVLINLVSSQATSRTKTCIIKLCENHLARETLNVAVWLRVHSQPMPICFINYVHISYIWIEYSWKLARNFICSLGSWGICDLVMPGAKSLFALS
jgi:hypothetical protein